MKLGVTTSWDHRDEDPSTWSEDYKRWTQDKPHAAAVSQAQERARFEYPTMVTPMGSEEDATGTMHHLLRQGGHPLADTGSVSQHNDPKRGFSQAYRSEGQFPSVDIHQSRWDYGTLAHEVAHHLHQHHDLGGRRPADDAEAHGPDFVKHYQNVLEGMLGRRKGPEASALLGDSYHEALGRIQGHHEATRKTAGEVNHPDYPHASAIHDTQKALRSNPSFGDALTQPLPPNADHVAQDMLGKLGHPRADEAFVVRHRDPSKNASATVFDTDGAPGVALHPERWDHGTLAHEVAHHMDIHTSGMDPMARHSDEEKHGPRFAEHYQRALELVHPDAGLVFGRAHPRILRFKLGARQEPTKRIFGPTYGLDVRLFDGEHLKPAVRQWVLETIERFWHPLYGRSWHRWAKPAFCGSEASEWTSPSRVGNGDFDVLVGIQGDLARSLVPSFAGLDDEAIVARLNADLTTLLWPRLNEVMIPNGDGEVGPFSVTVFVNAKAWRIQDIKPYAAYDLLSDTWAVKPPHLTHWSIESFPQGHALVQYCHAIAATVRSVLRMPEPYRSQSGDALWRFLHSDRGRAFTPQGEGWYDTANAVEKALDQMGLWEPLAKLHFDAEADPHKLDAPADWSNTPA